MCECCVFVASTELDQLESKEPVGWVRGAGIWAGVPNRQSVCAGTQGSVNVCVLVNLESSLLVEPANRKVASVSLSLGRDLRSLGTGLGSSGQAGGSPGMSNWRRQPLLTSLKRKYPFICENL